MMRKLRIGAVALAATTLVVGGMPAAQAATTPAQKCSAAKLKAVGKNWAAKLKCHGKAAKKGIVVDSECLTKAETKLDTAFSKAIAKGGCAVDADQFDLNADTITDGQVGSIRNQINNGFAIGTTLLYKGVTGPTITAVLKGIVPSVEPTPITTPAQLSKCIGKQLPALGKYASALFACQAKANKKSLALDSVCVDKANTKVGKAFAKADLLPDCQVTGEVNDLTSALFTTFNKIAPNMPPADGCGNNIVTTGEQCDDGNTTQFDSCPSDCTIDACTPNATAVPVRIVISDANAASVLIELDYPEGKVSLPGTGDTADVDNLAGSSVFDYLDFDHAFRLNASDALAFGTTDVARLNFVDCDVAGAPVVGDFTCTVLSASGAGGGSIPLPTCTVAIP